MSGWGFDVLWVALLVALVRLAYVQAARLEARVQRWAGEIPIHARPDDAVQAAWVLRERQVQLDRSLRRKP